MARLSFLFRVYLWRVWKGSGLEVWGVCNGWTRRGWSWGVGGVGGGPFQAKDARRKEIRRKKGERVEC